MPSRFAVFSAFLFSSLAVVFQGQTTPAPPSRFEGPAFSMLAQPMKEAAERIQPDKLSDVTILYEEADYRISDNGALSYVHRMVYRIETHRGVENWAESSIGWDPWYEDPSEIHARVLQTDGTFVELDPKTITDAPVNSDDSETYTSARERKAPLPGLAVGAIVEEVISVNGRKAYAPGGSAYRYYFVNSAPVDREKLVVDLPVASPFLDRVENLPTLQVTRTEAGGRRHVEYIQDHMPAQTYADIDLSSITQPAQAVEFSTGSAWSAVAHEYAALSDPEIVTSQAKVLLDAAPALTRLGRIQQLVQRLHKEVRYTGIEFNEAQLVPRSPAEVLQRHYGDCKDKATLLVSMLRAAGIPADLALLDAGNGNDVNSDLPGMNRFNHAIVYVPASGSDAALWIDATAEFSQVGSLPYGDANRLALIISPETTSLTATPKATPEDSVLIETRNFQLAELGPSHVVETSETHGYIDSTYRSRYGSTPTKSVNDDLERYAEQAYLAKSLTKFDHGDGADLGQTFHLTLSIDSARRGITALNDAAVWIFPASTLNDLPEWIKTAPAAEPQSPTPEQVEERAHQQAQRSRDYHIWPYTYEQRYVITAPAGFVLRALPPDHTTTMGPATLTEHYVQDSPTLVRAILRFSTGKSTISPQEALDLRQAVADANRREAIAIVFEQQGAKLVEAGKIKEGLAADQDTVGQTPQSALPHVRLARALLDVGVGDMARTEAARAVALDPTSPAALTTQGWVLEHDVLGKRFAPGYDRAGAIAAYEKALPLNSQDFDPRFDLAVQYEFNASGVMYGPGAELDKAAQLYRSLIDTEKKKNNDLTQYRVNLGYCLLFLHQYKELDAVVQDIPPGINHSTLAIAAAVGEGDAAAGIATADHLNLSVDDRNKGLLSAGSYLAQLGMYAQASEILAAGIQGQKDAPATARQIELYRTLQRVPLASPPVTSAESLVFASLNTIMSGAIDRKVLASEVTPHAYTSQAAFDRDMDKGMEQSGLLHMLAENSGTSEIVLRDLILGGMTIKSTGDDATGYRVISQVMGDPTGFFVVKEDGKFRIVADSSDSNDEEIGHYALYALDHNQPVLAKSILDWKRDYLKHRGDGDDSLDGPLMPRFWTVGSSRPGADSPEAMRIAAVSLAAGAMDLKPELDPIVLLRDNATGSRQEDLDLLLATGYLGTEQPALALKYIANLLQEEPDSDTALRLAGQAYAMDHDFKAWSDLLAPRLARRPTDDDLLRQQMRLEQEQHQYAAARATVKKIFDSGHAVGSDYNSYAWLGLFDHELGADVTSAAQQANTLSKSGSFADLHTTACVYAAQGKVTEAQQVLAQAMAAGNMSQPNSEVWYALGLLYEDYGLRDAALAAFGRVEAHPFDDHKFIDAESTYVLAQQEIAKLGKPERHGQ